MPVKDAKSIASKFLLPTLNFQSHRGPGGGNFGAPQNMGGLCFQVLGSLGSYCRGLRFQDTPPKAIKWFRREKSFTRKACPEFYYHLITDKFSLKFCLCITDVERLIQTSLLHFFVRFWVPSAFAKQADSTPAHLPYICKPIKTTWLSETGNLHQSRLRCCGKLRTLHQAKPRLWCSDYRYWNFLSRLLSFDSSQQLPCISTQFCTSL